MREINDGEGNIGSEVSEAEKGAEIAENRIEIHLSAKLDNVYQSYMKEGKISDFRKKEKDAGNIERGRGELSDADRAELKEKTGWSDEVIERIDTVEQAEIYKSAELHEEKINGRECLVKEIDYDYADEKTKMTNRELMAKGRSPYDPKTGEKIELHHMGQEYTAPFAELNENSEHGDGNHSILHPRTEGSWRHDKTLEAGYRKEKSDHWKTRSEE